MRFALGLCICAVLWGGVSPKEQFDMAAQALAAKDYAAAERGFEGVLRQEPRSIAALSNLGIIYSRTGRSDRAIEVYRTALRASPNDETIMVNLGLVYLRQEAHAKALPLFARVVAKDPKHLQARQLLAVCRLYTGQVLPAIRDLEGLRVSVPQNDQILFLLGFAYLKNHEPERANATFQLMFDAAGPVRAQFLLGQAYYEAALFPQAQDYLLKVNKLDPHFPELHLELGKVYISLRQNDDAIRELETALGENPADADASYFLGALLVQEGRYAEGIQHLERARIERPDAWGTYFYLGKAKLRLRQPEEAVDALQRAVALNPDAVSAYYQLGQSLQACGRQAEARKALAQVTDLKAAALAAEKLDFHVAGAR